MGGVGNPLNVLSLGAGVQSSALALMATRGELSPVLDFAVFADTQSEPEEVYKWLDWLEGQLSFPVHRVTQGNLRDAELKLSVSKKTGHTYRKALIPAYIDDSGMVPHRKCTSDYKIVPIRKFIRDKLGIKGKQVKERVAVQWIGISLDEVHRMRMSREPWIENRYPLIEKSITRTDCLRWLEKMGYPTPPRSACYFCPFHSDREWIRLRDDAPEEFQKAVEFEKQMNEAAAKETRKRRVKVFLHSSRKPLSEVSFNHDKNQPSLFGNECEGMCGV